MTKKTKIKFDVITLFPQALESYLSASIIKRAQEKNLVEINAIDLRSFATDKHHTTDEPIYGGGPGMLLKPDPVFSAVEKCVGHKIDPLKPRKKKNYLVAVMTPRGKTFNQKMAREISKKYNHMILICGRYEGLDERVHKYLADEEISIGDYVLSGGELPALVIAETIARLIPGVLGKAESLEDESFCETKKVEYPQYTRPENFRGVSVPKVLLSGDHKKILTWREKHKRKAR